MRKMQIFTALMLLAALPLPADAALESPWAKGHSSRARLIAGSVAVPEKGLTTLAGVEIEMPPGWKTYWRTPGDGGGVPPGFDWSASENLARATVLYPAPKRLSDKGGDTIGYKGTVVFPVTLEAVDAARPIVLRLAFSYGVCREICIPVEADLVLAIPADGAGPAPSISKALEQVPRQQGDRRRDDPALVRAAAVLGGAMPHLTIDASFPGDIAQADAFVEGPEGVNIPLAEKTAGEGEHVRFTIDLSSAVDPGDLKGATLLVTLVGAQGHSEARVPID